MLCLGCNAILLVEHAELNPMPMQQGMPHAGYLFSNVRNALAVLVSHSTTACLTASVVLPVQVGSFYEALGYDAILLVEHTGLNPMPIKRGMPHAGCPLTNIRSVLAALVSQGFTVVSASSCTAVVCLSATPCMARCIT